VTIAAPSAAGQADTVTLSAAVAGDAEEFRQLAAPYRRELLVHCYRMLNELSNYGGANIGNRRRTIPGSISAPGLAIDDHLGCFTT